VTGGDSGSKLVMKGSSVRVRASALKDLQNTHFCFLSGDELCARTRPLCDKRLLRALLADGEAEHRVGRPSDWCSRLALRSRPARASTALQRSGPSRRPQATSGRPCNVPAFATATTRRLLSAKSSPRASFRRHGCCSSEATASGERFGTPASGRRAGAVPRNAIRLRRRVERARARRLEQLRA
jgi:hypothetical protein